MIYSTAPRKCCRAGRRAGKTVAVSILAVLAFLQGRRVLYATPTSDQIDRFWAEVTRALAASIDAGVFVKNETRHSIELAGTEQRIRAKTAWDSDSLRGDYASLLILDEWQLMDEDAWGTVGAPMLLDNNGDAVFVYTPPSLHSRSRSKARDPQHAAKLFKRASGDTTGRWQTFHFTSHDNPHISRAALSNITQDMTALAYRMEIEAEDIDEAPGALWTRAIIEASRVREAPESMDRIVVAVDPSATSSGDEAGIVGCGRQGRHGYLLADWSLQGSPRTWASRAVGLYHQLNADMIVVEDNNGGEMVEETILSVDRQVRVKRIHASRGKATRAEPVVARYEQGEVHHVGSFPAAEDELALWIPGDASPNRLDAIVWGFTELLGGYGGPISAGSLDDYKSAVSWEDKERELLVGDLGWVG